MRNCALIHPLHLELETALSFPLSEGDRTVPYCAHRTISMLPPSLLVLSLGMGAD